MFKFHGLVLNTKKVTPFVPLPDGGVWNLKTAALPFNSKAGTKVALCMKNNESSEFLCIGTLDTDKQTSLSLDFILNAYTEFKLMGDANAVVHLSGFITPEDEHEDDAMNMFMGRGGGMGMEDDDDDDDDDDESNEGEDKPTIEELDNSDEQIEEDNEIKAVDINLKAPVKNAAPKQKQPQQPKSPNANAKPAEEGTNTMSKRAAKRQKQKAKSELKQQNDPKRQKMENNETPKPEPVAAQPEAGRRKSSLSTIATVDSGSPEKEQAKGQGQNGKPAKKFMKKFKNGFVIETLIEGKAAGKAATESDKVNISYQGRLEDGKVFDQSNNFTFTLGGKEVIRGIDKGVEGMAVGEKRKLIVPPSMGYGVKGSGDAIPGNATLIFTITLNKIE